MTFIKFGNLVYFKKWCPFLNTGVSIFLGNTKICKVCKPHNGIFFRFQNISCCGSEFSHFNFFPKFRKITHYAIDPFGYYWKDNLMFWHFCIWDCSLQLMLGILAWKTQHCRFTDIAYFAEFASINIWNHVE